MPTDEGLINVVIAGGPDKYQVLESALDRARLWEGLRAAGARAACEPAQLRILILVDLTIFEKGASTGTDPELVEHAIELLHERGYQQVNVGCGTDSSELWLENRDPVIKAELAGYHFQTRQGRYYDVLDLSSDIVPMPFPDTSVLCGAGLPRAWVDAQYRIVFAKNKTDERYGYALGAQSLLGVLPLRDKEYHYHHRFQPGDVFVDLFRMAPPQFSVIDAFISNHGTAGSRLSKPIETRTIIAGQDLLLTDWAAAVKMGSDPYVSPINAKALRERGLPHPHAIEGDLAPYEGWMNVHPMVLDSVRKRNASVVVSGTVQPWLQSVDAELFPFKFAIDQRLNAMLSNVFHRVDDQPAGPWVMVGLNYFLAGVTSSLDAMAILSQKDRLRRLERPLNLDLSQYTASDYESVVTYIEPLEDLIRRMPADANGLRWRYIDGSILFEFARVIPVSYEAFIGHVDIAKAVQFMNDYIGGACVPVRYDECGRVLHQAERNLYLPQPNYMVFYGGTMIDVSKLEFVRYRETEQKIFWRTLKSENQSATYDDGSVTFAKAGEEATLVTVMGRQQFTLPLFWQFLNLDLVPMTKDILVTHAYTSFFTQTMTNFEACYEGREFRIGHAWDLTQGEPGGSTGRPFSEDDILKVVGKVSEVLSGGWQLLSQASPLAATEPPRNGGVVDADGFVHFPGSGPARSMGASESGRAPAPIVREEKLKTMLTEYEGFLADMVRAVRHDVGLGREDE